MSSQFHKYAVAIVTAVAATFAGAVVMPVVPASAQEMTPSLTTKRPALTTKRATTAVPNPKPTITTKRPALSTKRPTLTTKPTSDVPGSSLDVRSGSVALDMLALLGATKFVAVSQNGQNVQ